MGNELGDRLRERAKELGLTDAEVARRLDFAQSRYAHYVAGTRKPDYQTLKRICRALLTSPDRVLGFSPEVERNTEDGILHDRAAAALDAMDTRALRLAADLLDVIVRQVDHG